jgi:hypothetical protein
VKRLLILMGLFAHPAWAQGDPVAAGEAITQPPVAACASESHRQFDFWVGQWTVTAGDQPAGNNRIEKRHQDCALAEHWTSAQGNFTGSSLNIYDAATGRWHQTWVDSSGTLLLLDGQLRNGQMVLEGTRPGTNGAEVRHRISWTPNPDGRVRQHWETRSGDGEWTTLFDGLYTRAEVK